MKRLHVNFAVDVLAFMAFLLLLSTGVLMRYQLPPGSGGLTGRGADRGAGHQTVSLLWGSTRHEWGDIHFWIAAIFLGVLAVHLVLHWNWIVCVVRGTHGEASGWRFGLGLASLCALVLLTAAPLLAPIESVTRERLVQQQSIGASDAGPAASSPQLEVAQSQGIDASDLGQLRGSATLAEVAAESGLSVEYLRGQLGLPKDTSPDARVGPTLREHGNRMSDLRRINTGPEAEQVETKAETEEGALH